MSVTVSTYIDLDIELDEISDDDLIDELDRRGLALETSSDTAPKELIEAIFQKRRNGKDYQRELDSLIYEVIGRVV